MPDVRAATENDRVTPREGPVAAHDDGARPVAAPRASAMRRHLRRWGAYWLVAGALLAASQVLWWWQTWPVRALLPDAASAAPGT